jgi:hypothetical protein
MFVLVGVGRIRIHPREYRAAYDFDIKTIRKCGLEGIGEVVEVTRPKSIDHGVDDRG